jgi:hypothetical protein
MATSEAIRPALAGDGRPVIEVVQTQQIDPARARVMLAFLGRQITALEARLETMRGRAVALANALSQATPATPADAPPQP